MTRDGDFKKVVRRHADATGQRYTEALTDLEGHAGEGEWFDPEYIGKAAAASRAAFHK